jgi:hypothetical protein
MKRLPIIRHVRWLLWRRWARKMAALHGGLRNVGINYPEPVAFSLNRIWRGDL